MMWMLGAGARKFIPIGILFPEQFCCSVGLIGRGSMAANELCYIMRTLGTTRTSPAPAILHRGGP